MSTPNVASPFALRAAAAVLLLLLAAAAPSQAREFTVCTLGFNTPDELRVFHASLLPPAFAIRDLSGQLAAAPMPGDATGTRPSIADVCRPDLRCDVVVYSAEFGGRFFGRYGFSMSLQDMEEASCQARCSGLFHYPREVFLLACNTLASKDEDSRTPAEYLQVLLDHGFERAAAEQVVQLRYGPIGPSFRESMRRIFVGVPHLYGFSSIAPRGEVTAPMLERYFRATGDYARHLEHADDRAVANAPLLAAFKATSMAQTTGLQPGDPAYRDRERVCALYDESRPLAERLAIADQLMGRGDFLAFLPTIEVLLQRHPPSGLQGDEQERFAAMQAREAARAQVLRLVEQLEPSAVKMQVADFARLLDWVSQPEFRRLAVDGAKQLLARPLTSEVVDIMCEITRREPLGDAFTSADLPASLFQIPEGLRLLDCLAPADPAVSTRLEAQLDHPDVVVRLWAGYALSRRLPLDERMLRLLADHLSDSSDDLRERIRWVFRAQRPLPRGLCDAIRRRDPVLADELRAGDEAGRRSHGRRAEQTACGG